MNLRKIGGLTNPRSQQKTRGRRHDCVAKQHSCVAGAEAAHDLTKGMHSCV